MNIGDFNLCTCEHWCKCSMCDNNIKKGEKYLRKYVTSDYWGKPRYVNIHLKHFLNNDIKNAIILEEL